MSWPSYPTYKPSGLPWIGSIPTHWQIAPNRSVLELRRELVGTKSAAYPLLSLTLRGVIVRDISENKGKFPAEFDTYQVVDPGNLVFCLFDIEETPRTVGLAKDRGMVTGAYDVFRVRDSADGRFIEYLYRALDEKKSLSYFYSGMRKVIRMPTFKSIRCPVPSLTEQRIIVDFLDYETAKIDALIGKQEQLIATLREGRTATITKAVTKGLDPNVEMKDSGVEWLGWVPNHWGVRQLKWGSPVRRGASPRPIDDPKYFDDDGEWSWVRIADVSASGGHLYETTQRLSALGSTLSVRLNPGSLFISIAGTVGKPCVTHIPVCIHDGFVYFPSLDMETEYLYRIFEAGECYRGLGKMGTQLNLNTDTIGSIRLPFPSRAEQQGIVEYLGLECGKIDGLIEKALEVVDTLREYRSALILAAVTGKIDVREGV